VTLHLAELDPNVRQLLERGYQATGSELELMADTTDEPQTTELPDGFRFTSLREVGDAAYIEGHIAAWSDTKPSAYRRELHDAVKQMPSFHADLVTIALAPDGTVASYCIGWLDERSQTLEIEPLGTHRDYRQKRLAHAVVKEVQHRAWANGAKHVLVWNDPAALPKANGLYVGADMPPNRTLVELSKQL
jgi:GNAT superfamily N-acetyltransferase